MNTGLKASEFNQCTATVPNEDLYTKETSDFIFQCSFMYYYIQEFQLLQQRVKISHNFFPKNFNQVYH